ncbi:hypothetical protein OSB04_006059 [Centaurea solstitialis]|uniref:Uncharacterized protein n=1 Tax=Centaurea solstitialis TaxID=347529 RepID=A0AA38WRT3_9ASTR|nr:hypothetical protein OSB04_006059 [Centaurea solstitialis]
MLVNYSICISSEEAIKEPLHPQQILPLLPDQVSLPIPRPSSFRGILDFHVIYVASAKIADDSKLPWKGSCFNENTAWLELHNKSGTQFGGGTVYIKAVFSLKQDPFQGNLESSAILADATYIT